MLKMIVNVGELVTNLKLVKDFYPVNSFDTFLLNGIE